MKEEILKKIRKDYFEQKQMQEEYRRTKQRMKELEKNNLVINYLKLLKSLDQLNLDKDQSERIERKLDELEENEIVSEYLESFGTIDEYNEVKIPEKETDMLQKL